MVRLRPLALALLLGALPLRPAHAAGLAAAQEIAAVRPLAGVLAAGTPAATGWRAVVGPEPGPTVVLVGGVHGDEPAGARAARQVASWTLVRGRLVVVERANVRALEAGRRTTPGLPEGRRDLNRQFPPAADAEPLVRDLWELVREERPAVLVDLHEGFDFHRENPASVGSSVIASAAARSVARPMVEALDATVELPSRRFAVLGPPIGGSLARAAADRLGVPSMIVETTTRGQSLPFRVRQHRLAVRALLEVLGLVEPGPDALVGAGAGPDLRRVALYASSGAAGPGLDRLEGLLDEGHGFLVRRVCAADVRAGSLGDFDAVIFPGGSGSGQGRSLGEAGRAEVRRFVADGGGYLGLCAGSYLAALNYDWSLGLVDANVIDRAHWKRGRAHLPLVFLPDAVALGAPGEGAQEVLYANGPILEAAGDPAVPDFRVLATFAGEVADHGAPRGVMPGTPALVAGTFGEGAVVCSSPHPEQTPGYEALVRGLVGHVARRARGR